MRTMHRIALSTLAVAVALTFAGCSSKKEEKGASQVVAKVNDDEITVHQLNFELAKMGNVDPAQAKQAANQVLKSMVDQQLLVQAAIENKIDRDPQVLQTIEANRRQILAQAQLQKMTANQAKSSDAEVADYYTKNPALFSDRHIYRLQEINIKVTPENANAVKAQLQQTKNLGDFVNWLKTQDIPAQGGQTTKTAEQLPLELLPRLQQMKNGQALTLAAPGMLNILVLIDAKAEPVTQEQAKAKIALYLENTKKRDEAKVELKKLEEKAKIEYLGEYAKAGETAPAAAPPPTASTPDAVQPAPAGTDTKKAGE